MSLLIFINGESKLGLFDLVGRICTDLGPDCSLFVKSTKFSGMTELIVAINM